MQDNGRFPGFTLPDGAWLPPEFMDILPDMRNVSEIKVTIAAIYEALRVGGNGAVISLAEFEALTGLDAKGVLRGIKAAVARGTMHREHKGKTYYYRLAINATGTMPVSKAQHWHDTSGTMPPDPGMVPVSGGIVPVNVMHECTSPITSRENMHEHDEHDATGKMPVSERADLVHKMRELGVALKVAQDLASRYDASYLSEKLRQAHFAVKRGLASNGAAWFVASVRDNWGSPLGYDPKAHMSDEERRKRYIKGKYADFIQH